MGEPLGHERLDLGGKVGEQALARGQPRLHLLGVGGHRVLLPACVLLRHERLASPLRIGLRRLEIGDGGRILLVQLLQHPRGRLEVLEGPRAQQHRTKPCEPVAVQLN